MTRALLAIALAMLLVPTAAAQFIDRPGMVISEPVPGFPGGGGGAYAELRLQTANMDMMPVGSPWLAVGYDTVLNLTLRNGGDEGVNATFRINVTGATATPTEVRLYADPYMSAGATFVVHPEDSGLVEVRAEAIDAFQPGGDPITAILTAPALRLPSARFLDPPSVAPPSEDDEFQQIDGYRGTRIGISAYLRIRPGESIVPRIELTNPFEATIPGFRLTLQSHTHTGQYLEAVDVAEIEPGGTRTVEFPEFLPVDSGGFGGGWYGGGPMGSFELRPLAEFPIGGQPLSAGLASFRIERGAIEGFEPTVGVIDVQDGMAVDLAVPRKPVLGVPTRILYNLTNLGTSPAQGRLILQVMTPNGLFYEVQGPEVHEIAVGLGPGERTSGSVELTPRVTGHWSISSMFRSGQGFGYGGGGGFEVKGPVVLGFDRADQIFARIGEPIEVGLAVATTQPLQDAQLRVTSGSQYYQEPRGSGADHRPGFADTLIESRSPTQSLGTLRPGGEVNASIEIVGRSSGYYTIVPYLLAEGFAYTSTPDFSRPGGPILFQEMPFQVTMLSVLVQPRPVPAALSLLPLTIGLAFFVGAWTLRTRFVK